MTGFLPLEQLIKAAVLFLKVLLTATEQVLWSQVVNWLPINFAIAAFPKPAPDSLISSENLTEIGTWIAMGTRLQTNKMAGWFRIIQWKLSKE